MVIGQEIHHLSLCRCNEDGDRAGNNVVGESAQDEPETKRFKVCLV